MVVKIDFSKFLGYSLHNQENLNMKIYNEKIEPYFILYGMLKNKDSTNAKKTQKLEV